MSLAYRDVFGQICDAVGLSGDILVAVTDLEFYGDAGGTRERSNIALGGYLATVDQWRTFREAWRALLDEEGVECFHRTDMEPPFYGEFREKGWTTNHQVPVLRRLHKIIKGDTIRGIGHAVRNVAFAQLTPAEIKRTYGGPYGWCVLLEVVEVGLWARRRNQWVNYFFEAGDTGQAQANATLKKLYDDPKYREFFRIAGWSFVPKSGPNAAIQVQAADFIAFEAYKDIDNFLKGSPREARKSRKDLIRPKRDELRFWADKAFANWLARLADFNGDVIETLITTDPNS